MNQREQEAVARLLKGVEQAAKAVERLAAQAAKAAEAYAALFGAAEKSSKKSGK